MISNQFYNDNFCTIYCGHVLDVLRQMDSESVQCVVTSPPYWGLRDYGLPEIEWTAPVNTGLPPYREQKDGIWRGSLGLEPTPELYIAHLVEIFREVRRVLRRDGTLWLNLGDSYAGSAQGWCKESGQRIGGPKQKTNAGSIWPGGRPPGYISSRQENGLKPKDLCMIPFRVAMALQADGWWLRSDIIWSKPNPMPESVQDRPTRSHEYLFLLTKAARYFYDAEAIKEPCESGPSDIRKMIEKKDRIGGKHKTLIDPYSKASSTTQMGRKRAVGGRRIHGNIPGRDDDGRACNKPDQLYRNRRTVWTIATQPYKDAHFATFPEKLVEPCVLAGTSKRGCCPKCGAPWERVVEKNFIPQPDIKNPEKLKRDPSALDQSSSWGGSQRGSNHSKTLGWRPTCKCGISPIERLQPCIVLDPFGGSGVVGVVAKKLGRKAILIDLKQEYCEMAAQRLPKQERLSL